MRTKVESLKYKGISKLQKIFFVVCLLFFSIYCNAQCAMCRASLESEGNGVKAEAVNNGIVYLMIIPYVLAATIAYIVYRMYKKSRN